MIAARFPSSFDGVHTEIAMIWDPKYQRNPPWYETSYEKALESNTCAPFFIQEFDMH